MPTSEQIEVARALVLSMSFTLAKQGDGVALVVDGDVVPSIATLLATREAAARAEEREACAKMADARAEKAERERDEARAEVEKINKGTVAWEGHGIRPEEVLADMRYAGEVVAKKVAALVAERDRLAVALRKLLESAPSSEIIRELEPDNPGEGWRGRPCPFAPRAFDVLEAHAALASDTSRGDG